MSYISIIQLFKNKNILKVQLQPLSIDSRFKRVLFNRLKWVVITVDHCWSDKLESVYGFQKYTYFNKLISKSSSFKSTLIVIKSDRNHHLYCFSSIPDKKGELPVFEDCINLWCGTVKDFPNQSVPSMSYIMYMHLYIFKNHWRLSVEMFQGLRYSYIANLQWVLFSF